MSRKIIAFLILLAIVALAAAPTWYRYYSTRKIHEHWGPATLMRITRASKAELLVFKSPDDPVEGDVVNLAGGQYAVARRMDLDRIRGSVHLRTALGQDASFDWDEPPRDERPLWRLVLAFTDGDEGDAQTTTIVAFDLDQRIVWTSDPDKRVRLTKHINDGVKKFLADVEKESNVP